MKTIHFFTPLFLLILLQACSVNEDPDFVTMQNVRVKKMNDDQFLITANALYYNPNDVGCTLTKTEVDVYIDDLFVGAISQTKATEIAAKSNFTIPMSLNFSAKKVFKDKKKILENLAIMFGTKEVNVRFDGDVTVSIVGVNYSSGFKYSEKIPLKGLR